MSGPKRITPHDVVTMFKALIDSMYVQGNDMEKYYLEHLSATLQPIVEMVKKDQIQIGKYN